MAIGNTKVDELIKRAKLLSDSFAWFEAFDNTTREQIISWIQNDQLRDEGIDKFGKIIGTYSYATELLSNGLKRAGNPYDLFDTGDFFRSFVVMVFKEEIVINANSNTFDEMKKQKWYSNGILGLTDENFTKLKEKVKNSYIDYARKVLQIN